MPLNWWQLRSTGTLWLLKVSYASLIVIPFASHILTEDGFLVRVLGLRPWLIGALFFASFFLALANLVFDISCPVVVKRFASPNDMYEKMLEIRKLSTELYPQDNFRAELAHCTSAYQKAAGQGLIARWAASLLYFLSALLFTVVFVNRAYVVGRFVLGSLCPLP